MRQITWHVVFFLAILGVFASHFLPAKYPASEGQVAPSTIRAPQTITFVDVKQTAERKKIAADNVEEIYTVDKKYNAVIEDEIEQFFNNLNKVARRDDIDSKEKLRILRAEYGLPELAATVFLSVEFNTVKALQAEALNIYRNNWESGVKEGEVNDRRSKLFAQIELLNYNAPFRDIIKSAFNKLDLEANYFPDQEATLKAREEASRSEGDVLVTIRKGQKIIGEGEVVTSDQLEVLKALGIQRTSSPYVTLAGITVYLIVILALLIMFLKFYSRDKYSKGNNLTLMSLLIFITLLLAKLISAINISPLPEVAELVNYLIPVAAGSMLLAILMDTKLAVFLTIILSFFVGILTENQLTYTINAFVGGVVSIYSVSKFSQRLDWVKAGLFVGIADVFVIFALSLMNNASWDLILIGCVMGAMNGFLSAIFAYGTLPFLESGFKVTTSVRLLELSNPNQPLLKRLLIEAPGTYHHSILVGNLGEAAADAVGADSLLVRVGSYYHDIGKLKRPYFFIENQLGGENPHEKLTPSLSTLIITSHIKDGLELARQYGVPPIIMDLIAQHHGTCLVTYFYHKAVEMGNADSIKEEEFRYDAPKPQSKEAAIIMLADNVEAAVRSMTSHTSGKIEGLVRKILKERLQDGQLDESDLTFKDVDLIANAFSHILNGIFHTRIEYPENVLKALEGGALADGDTDRKPAGKSEED